MPQGKAYGTLNTLEKGPRKTKKTGDSRQGGKSAPSMEIRQTSAKRALLGDGSIERGMASTGAPEKLKGANLQAAALRKDMIPEDTADATTEPEKGGVYVDDGVERDVSMLPTASQQSALFGGRSYGQALGYMPKSYWGSRRDIIKPDQTGVDQAAALYYMK